MSGRRCALPPALAVGMACLLAMAVPAASEGASGLRGKNLIVVVIDSLRADHMGVYGYSRRTTPFIDRIAQDAVVFDEARSTSSYTAQSVTSLLTGRMPSCLGAAGWGSTPPANGYQLVDSFGAAGYATGFFTTTVVLRTPFSGRFDEREVLVDAWNASGQSPRLTERGLDFIRRHTDRPFFLYLHYLDPHAPYAAGAELRSRFDVPVHPKPLRVYSDLRVNYTKLIAQGLTPDSPVFADLVARYDAEIAHVDLAIEALFEGLAALGHADDTLVVLTSDHGEELLDHAFVEHAWTLYEESIRIPLIFWAPDRLAPQRDRRSVSHVDLAPTLIDLLLEEETSREFDGRALFPAGRPGPEAPPYLGELLLPNRNIVRTVVRGRWKYLAAQQWLVPDDRPEAVKLDGGGGARAFDLWRPPVRIELYDLMRDGAERDDLSRSRPAELAEMQATLAAFAQRCPGEGGGKSRTGTLSEEQKEGLRALGYIE